MKNTVLLTGATGSLGSAVLEQLLAQNHGVIVILRSKTKSEAFLSKKFSQHVAEGSISFVEIADMSSPHAFDDAASRATEIIHIATPLAFTNFEETVIKPTWPILENVLTAANASSSVRRVIVTGSIVSTLRVPEEIPSGRTISEKDWNPITRAEATANLVKAYQYAKTDSERKAWDFMERERPSFDLVVLLAPNLTGRSRQEGFVPEKGPLGGLAGIYREILDRDEPGRLLPYFM